MSSQPAIMTAEVYLREFCEACLELLSGQSPHGSILAEVLPSFGRVMQSCARSDTALLIELNEWKQKSQQVVRLATLHCGTESEGLISSLEQVSHEATRAVAALAALGNTSKNDVMVLSDSVMERPEGNAEFPRPGTLEGDLQALCESVLALLNLGPDDSSVLSQTMPSLPRIFAGCGLVVLAQLRAELNVSRTTSEQLMLFAGAHHGSAAKQLAERIQEAQDSAERLITAMELLADEATNEDRLAGYAPLQSPAAITEQNFFPPTTGDGEPSSAKLLFELGVQSHQRQDFQTAETLYTAALKLDSTFRLAWLQRGRIRLRHGNASQAIGDLTRALQLFADDPVTIRWRGDALAMCGQYKDALKDYNRSLEMLPESNLVRYNRAVVFRLMGKLDFAWSELEQILQQRTNDPGVHLNRGLICLARDQQDQAIQEFQAALAAQPGMQEAIDQLNELGVKTDNEPEPKKKTTATIRVIKTSDAELKVAKSSPRSATTQRRQTAAIRSSKETSVAHKTVVTESGNSAAIPVTATVGDEMAMSLLSEPSPPPVLEKPHGSGTPPSGRDSTFTSSGGTPAIEDKIQIQEVVAATDSAADAASPSSTNRVSMGSGSTRDIGTSIEIHCPTCDGVNFMRWERLQPGKVFNCSRCSHHFVVQSDGTLVAVTQNRNGKWIESAESPIFLLWKDRRIMAAVAAALVLVSFLFLRPGNVDHIIIPDDPTLPQELEPRAKMLTIAWLKGDFHTMRKLTNSVQNRYLLLWLMEHPIPLVTSPGTLERDAKFSVEIVNAQPPNASVHVSVDGIQIASGNPVSRLPLQWKQEGERWMFQPAPPRNL